MNHDRIFSFVEDVEHQAEWREEKAKEYPDDERNEESADGLRALAKWVENNPDSPLLVELSDALDRLYDSGDSYWSFEPGVTDRIGRIGFDYVGEPVEFIADLISDIEEFLDEDQCEEQNNDAGE